MEMNKIFSVDFENTVTAALENCPPETVYLASVSGGADSTAMLAALAAIRLKKNGFDLRCIHIEHGIRPEAESRGDAEFVRSLCKTLAIPCRIVHIPPGKIAATAKKFGIGIEATARFYRRRAWFKMARELKDKSRRDIKPCLNVEGQVRILTAHTADDMLETVLMRILRGAGPSGLSAMPTVCGRLLRPMLAVSRSDVHSYLSEKNISWREDSTNADIRFFRNRIRGRLPLLDAEFPQWRKAVASFAETQSLAANFIREEAAGRIQWCRNKSAANERGLETDAGNFFAQPAIIREEALFQGIDKLLTNSTLSSTVKRKNIRRFTQGNITAIDLGPFQIRKDSNQVMIFQTPHSPVPYSETGFTLLINAPGLYNLKGIAIEVHESQAGENRGCGTFLSPLPLVIKPFQKGDNIVNAASGGKNSGKPRFTAVDTHGATAFIGPGGLIQCRDEKEALTAAGKCWVVKITVNRSTDVKRTE